MSVDGIIKLVQAISENGLTSPELRKGEPKLLLKHEKEMPQIVTVSAPSADAVSIQIAAVQSGLAGPPMMSLAMMSQNVASPQATRNMASGVDISSDKVATFPLVGTFYNASSSDAAPFVQAGDIMKEGQALGIIEAMKLMNEIESKYDSVVEAVLVNDGEVVEYGQPLLCVK